MFGFGRQYFTGVDFGTSSIKVATLSVKDKRPILVNYGEAALDTFREHKAQSQSDYDAFVASRLKTLLEKMGTTGHDAYLAMPAFIGLVAVVDFPEMQEKELDEAIRIEAHKYIPTPLDEVALSWEVLDNQASSAGEGVNSAGRMEILLVAALKKEVDRYEGYTRDVGLQTKLLELETFSLARSIINGDPGISLVIDIGSRATNLILVDSGRVKVSRNLDVGGQDITRTIADNLNISIDRAETLKKSDKDFLTIPEGKLIFPTLESITREARRIMEDFSIKHPQARFDGIILSGGTAKLTGLTKHLSDLLEIPVSIGNPWRQILYEPKLEPAIERMGTSFSVALGLALYGAESAIHKK